MLEAVPANFFSSTFALVGEKGLLGELDNSIWRDAAQLELLEGTYALYRQALFSGDFVLERDGKVVARATKPSVLKNMFEVELPSGKVVLRKLGVLSRQFGVFEGGKQIGTIAPLGIFARRAQIDLPAAWPAAAQGFLFWLTFLLWRRQRQAAS
jgi:hypothetical protein